MTSHDIGTLCKLDELNRTMYPVSWDLTLSCRTLLAHKFVDAYQNKAKKLGYKINPHGQQLMAELRIIASQFK